MVLGPFSVSQYNTKEKQKTRDATVTPSIWNPVSWLNPTGKSAHSMAPKWIENATKVDVLHFLFGHIVRH